MIPAGPKRDKVIAETKGGYKTCEAPIIVNHRCNSNGLKQCEKRKCEHYKHKPFSSDILCAMELWDEMLTSDRIGFERWRANTWKGERGYRARIENVWTSIEILTHNKHKTLNEALADAISGAWLKWREAQG